MEKENKNKFLKPSFANVSDGRAMRNVQQTFEGVLNSTAKSSADFIISEADLSTISCSVYELKSGPASQASSAAKSDLNFMVNSNDLNVGAKSLLTS